MAIKYKRLQKKTRASTPDDSHVSFTLLKRVTRALTPRQGLRISSETADPRRPVFPMFLMFPMFKNAGKARQDLEVLF